MRAAITGRAKPAPKPRKMNEAQLLLVTQLASVTDATLPSGSIALRLQPEYQFHATRKWRIDVALLDHDIAIEIDGGAWIQGRHGRGTGIEKDNEKYAALAIAGWRLIRCTPGQVKKGLVLEWVKQALAQEAA
jgi:very-short-patch-repair endonuclease